MTSSSPIHHSRFPAQQGQAALLALTIVSSQAGFSSSLGAWGRGSEHPHPQDLQGREEQDFSHS